MSKKVRLAVALMLTAAAGVALAGSQTLGSSSIHDPEVTERIIEIGKGGNRAMEHLAHLCNEIGPRPAGSRNHQEASEWAYEKFKGFGLSNVHLEQCGAAHAYPDAGWAEGLLDKLARAVGFGGDDATKKTMVPVYNVIADIPGTEKADEYVIIGAHFDSVPIGTGALDNGTGVAAAMEAARILVESKAKPKRTIRFVLFAGEESGLIGSRGYIEAHPELLPKISAMYNMDHGTNYISGLSVTEPLKADMDAIFAPVRTLDPGKSFEVEVVDWLLKGDPNCCPEGVRWTTIGEEGPAVIVQAYKKNPDGSLERVEADPDELESLAAGAVPATGDSLERRVVISGACAPGCGDGQALSMEDLKAMGLLPEGEDVEGAEGKTMFVAIGSSDQSVFLAAGVPGFWWAQDGDSDVRYACHSANDTYDAAIPEYLEHSATVIALGALGTANLDHMLSREKLTKPDNEAAGEVPAVESRPKEVKTPSSACCTYGADI
jgi:hypothetical protein